MNSLHAARACVEIDVAKTIPAKIWVHVGEEGFFQDVIVEGGMAYCMRCRIHGHELATCKKAAKSHTRIPEAAKTSKTMSPPVVTAPTPMEKDINDKAGWTKVVRRKARNNEHHQTEDAAIIDNLVSLTNEAEVSSPQNDKEAHFDMPARKDNCLIGTKKINDKTNNNGASYKAERPRGIFSASKRLLKMQKSVRKPIRTILQRNTTSEVRPAVDPPPPSIEHANDPKDNADSNLQRNISCEVCPAVEPPRHPWNMKMIPRIMQTSPHKGTSMERYVQQLNPLCHTWSMEMIPRIMQKPTFKGTSLARNNQLLNHPCPARSMELAQTKTQTTIVPLRVRRMPQ